MAPFPDEKKNGDYEKDVEMDSHLSDTDINITTNSNFITTSALEEQLEEEEAKKKGDDDKKHDSHSFSWMSRYTRHVASHPWKHLGVAMILSIVISGVGMVVGNFSVSADNNGWQSRGTLIANRQSQALLIRCKGDYIRQQGETAWQELTQNVQGNWESDLGCSQGGGGGEERNRHLLHWEQQHPTTSHTTSHTTNDTNDKNQFNSIKTQFHNTNRSSPVSITSLFATNKNRQDTINSHNYNDQTDFQTALNVNPAMRRQLQDATSSTSEALAGCDTSYYTRIFAYSRLFPVWKINDETTGSILSGAAIRDICIAEQNTQQLLETNGYCAGCDSPNKCLPPFSIVFFARLTVGDSSISLSCDQLATTWENDHLDTVQPLIQQCVSAMLEPTFNIERDPFPDVCPSGFFPSMVDESMLQNDGRVLYTASAFTSFPQNNYLLTKNTLYTLLDQYDRAGDVVTGAYDMDREDFVEHQVEVSVNQDMVLAMGSAFITAIAILVHTKSPWLTLIGLIQIILSFPLAYFVYTFIGQLEFFPFLNFIGVFVVFALGADDVFVAVDKWKNARLANPQGPVADVAAVALPDAASAMFLTTLTTAVAFFATAICPVAPLKCFAIFCGLLITFDYIMCVFLVFPALCIYDNFNQRGGGNCCCSLTGCCKKKGDGSDEAATEDDKEKVSFIHRILSKFYDVIHLLRWPLLAACIVALVISTIFAARLELPKNSDVRLLNPNKFQQEQAYEWRRKLLSQALTSTTGNPGYVVFGVDPADTGKHNDPSTFTQLVLDDTFDPSSEEAQIYLRDFCDRFFAQDFASLTSTDYKCPINRFDSWLQEQSTTGYQPDSAYTSSCNGATALPMDSTSFNQCVSAWAEEQESSAILSRDDVMKYTIVRFQQRVRFDSPFNELNSEWNLIEQWMENERNNVAPQGVNKMYHSSFDFWWYDTNGSMLSTAYSASGIALGAAGIVVLFSSRSVILTIFSLITIGYVLTSTTAMLVASGWTLGFLESICFSILIGISCDFVIHFGHAYAGMTGTRGQELTRHDRTKHALIFMGPSILAAGFTTICGAMVMIFTIISFFQRFATILFYTIIQATLASFVLFLVLTDTVGPAKPTSWVDSMTEMLCGKEEAEHNGDKKGSTGFAKSNEAE
mmetsp:Transcript_13477/g.19413  ORF Transcript_13477/g.19413 Transcript_13477/m.19413 type:complete len:1143 (+) Transcript_13477:65-3493(+)|eukprot:CAMPEP_0202449234 /NCGR_PEP_ID=MMETSP1360-20130828/7981_1 /ASSEMBLY_ACC=CAM_ASM_000848 /TAXON_ID=515479 /ORGANISM="Licmophora paradoxa, Strain CCMP2313" /LENGTH=1142 /DNA_ID=CAMNT_0049067097 /DNA_START=106 /DNA_END=3534 /DNA_ORIENTATION=+